MKRTTTRERRIRRVQHAVLRTGALLAKVGDHHVIGVFLICHGVAMALRHYGTVNLIEQATHISNVWTGAVIALGGVVYFVSHPASRLSLAGLLPHVFYTLFALVWAAPRADAPLNPPLAYITILALALGKFFGYHLGSILFSLSARWELNEQSDANV